MANNPNHFESCKEYLFENDWFIAIFSFNLLTDITALSLKYKYFANQFQAWLVNEQNCIALRYALLSMRYHTYSTFTSYGT